MKTIFNLLAIFFPLFSRSCAYEVVDGKLSMLLLFLQMQKASCEIHDRHQSQVVHCCEWKRPMSLSCGVVCIYWTTGNDLSIHCVQSSCFIDSIIKYIYFTPSKQPFAWYGQYQKKTTNLNAILCYNDRAASSGMAFGMSFSGGLNKQQRQQNILKYMTILHCAGVVSC